MAIPEISHRCALCGASIRPGADSCPNCGQGETVSQPPRYEPAPALETPPPAIETVPEETPEIIETVEEDAPELPDEEAAPEQFAPLIEEEIETPAPVLAEPPPAVAAAQPAPPVIKVLDGPPPVYKKRRRRRYQPPTMKERLAYRVEQLQGASKEATRKVAPTVEQLRETSNTVLDRADTDPSARFLIIGALLAAVAAFVFIVSFFWG
jgi:hypothetical protein